MNTQKIGEIWDSYNIPKRLRNSRLESYIPQQKSQGIALERCKHYVSEGVDRIKQGNGLFIHGPVGTGKSHLAAATVYEIIKLNPDAFGRMAGPWDYEEPQGIKFAFISVVDLLATLRESYDGNEYKKEHAYRLMRQVRGHEIIVLDDIGAEKPSEWVDEQLYGIIDLRYRMERATIFTTNCSVNQLEKQIGSRTVSRIIDMTDGIGVDGPDYRKRKLA